MNTLSKEELCEWLDYNPENGEFRWLKSNSDKIKVGSLAGSKKYIIDNNDNKVKKGATVRIEGKSYSLTVLTYIFMTGEKPMSDIIHLNYDKWDFRWENLDLMSHGEATKRVKHISDEDYRITLVGHNGDYGAKEKFVLDTTLTHEKLKSLVEYDPEIGIIRRLFSTSNYEEGSVIGSYEEYGENSKHTRGTRHRVKVTISGTNYSAHRLIWFYMTGKWPEGVIDHINGDPWDNRWVNLRDVSNIENSKNKGLGVKNKSGVLGVYWAKSCDKWGVQINSEGKRINLGYFKEFDDAVKARKDAEVKYNYHPNHGKRFVK